MAFGLQSHPPAGINAISRWHKGSLQSCRNLALTSFSGTSSSCSTAAASFSAATADARAFSLASSASDLACLETAVDFFLRLSSSSSCFRSSSSRLRFFSSLSLFKI